MTSATDSSRALFWAFSLVAFSKILWYDVRVYLPQDDRRTFVTGCVAVWIYAQGLVYYMRPGIVGKRDAGSVVVPAVTDRAPLRLELQA